MRAIACDAGCPLSVAFSSRLGASFWPQVRSTLSRLLSVCEMPHMAVALEQMELGKAPASQKDGWNENGQGVSSLNPRVFSVSL